MDGRGAGGGREGHALGGCAPGVCTRNEADGPPGWCGIDGGGGIGFIAEKVPGKNPILNKNKYIMIRLRQGSAFECESHSHCNGVSVQAIMRRWSNGSSGYTCL